MNIIKHDGKTYEVLTLDQMDEAKYVATASGKVFPVMVSSTAEHPRLFVSEGFNIFAETWEDLGIQPLRLVPNEPVTFEGVVESVATRHRGYIVVPNKEWIGKRFRCVEIVEEGA